MRTSTGVQWLLGDHLGSISVVVNASGVAQSTQLYKPWGESRYSSSASPTKYLYTGQMKEGALGGVEGLYYYGARYYDPSLGRWSQPDSIISDQHNPQDWDRYVYSRNNPVKYTDPSGHSPTWWDYIGGAAYQYANDVTLGAVDKIAESFNLCMDCNRSAAFEQGMGAGRTASIVVSSTEMVLGTAAAAEGLAAIGPTAGGGILCAAATAGACLAVAGVGLTVEGAVVVGGTLEAVHGAATAAFINSNSLNSGNYSASNFAKNLQNRVEKPTNIKNPQAHHMLQQALEARFKKLGINIHDPKWGAWVEGAPPGSHQKWTSAYQREWGTWLDNNPNSTIEDIENQASYMAQEYGISWK
jgi:RHS repeat-associated protein